ncbi:MAG TPA: ABC transporter permease [Candidatus Acidoferrales bacterium]|nr:ABC transporter permease [Candidatus Acidoferrales bacterium]
MADVAYVVRKLAGLVVTIFLVLTFNFYLFRIVPGNPFALLFRGAGLSANAVRSLSAQFGINQPIWVQYVLYLRNTLSGNLGLSFQTRAPVIELLIPALINTAILLGAASVISIVLGILIGMLAAWRRGSTFDVGASAITLVLYSMPTFWLGLILLVVGVIYLGLPVAGMQSFVGVTPGPVGQLVDLTRHMILPLLTLVLGLVGQYVLVMKGALLDVFTEDFMITARAKGISNRKLLLDHGFRNAVLPMVALVALNIGLSIGGAVQTETIFSWPGMGLLIYRAILTRDYPVLQGSFLVVTVAVIIANFVADMLYPLLDPRVAAQ